MNKEEIANMYKTGIINADEVIKSLIDKFKIDKYSIDIQQARLIIDYLLINRELDEEYIEHEIVDRLYCLQEQDFDKTKVDDSYIQTVIKAGKENKELVDKFQEEIENAKWYIHQMVVHISEDIIDYVDDDKEGNRHIIGELKETRKQWQDVERLLNGESKDTLYIDWRKYGEYE